MRLQDYPMPPNRSKRGVHGSASMYPEEGHWRDRLALCREMGIGWIKFVDDGGASGLNVYRACWHEYGMIPIVRFYIGTPGQCGPREEDAIRRIADTLGFATYFELCNEPDLPIEWGYQQPRDWLYQAVNAYCDYAPKVLAAGGLPGTFALASGAFGQMRIDEKGNEIPPTKVNFIKLIVDKIGREVFDRGGWVSMHNYTINHPIAYPYDVVNQNGQQLTVEEYDRHPGWTWDNRPMQAINEQRARDKNPGDTIWDDDTCFRAYMVFKELLHEVGLDSVPLITTEGGPTLTRGDDGRYPKIHIDLMCEMLVQMYREMATIPQYFAHCHWMLYNTTYGWESDRWLDGAEDYSKAIALFKTTPVGAWGEVINVDVNLPDPPELPWPSITTIKVKAGDVVREIGLEEYLRDVVPAEMPALWHEEALRAQAIAARSYALWRKENPVSSEFDLYGDTRDQVWNPKMRHPRGDEAVKATTGLYLVRSGQTLCARYVDKCGQSQDICPYCKGVILSSTGKRWPGRFCQYGAKDLADKGKVALEILRQYYGDVKLMNEWPKNASDNGGGGTVPSWSLWQDPRTEQFATSGGKVVGEVVRIKAVEMLDSPVVWRASRIEFLDEDQAKGDVNIYVTLRDEAGRVIAGQARVMWPAQKIPGPYDGTVVGESKAEKPFEFPQGGGNFFPQKSTEYGPYVVQAEGLPSDLVYGFGLAGNRHVAFKVEFRKQAKVSLPEEPGEEPGNGSGEELQGCREFWKMLFRR